MFKIICNVGRWGALFESRHMSQALAAFMPDESVVSGKTDGLLNRPLIALADPKRCGSREQQIILVSEDALYGELIATILRTELSSGLKLIVAANNTEEVVDVVSRLLKRCWELDAEFAAKANPKQNNSGGAGRLWSVMAVLLL